MLWRTKRLLDNVWGPMGTVIVHVVVVVALVHFMTVKERATTSEMEVVIQEIEEFKDLEDIEEELDELEDIPTVVESVRSNLVTILGRTAAYENRVVTWDEIMACDEPLVADLKGLKA